MRYLLDANIVSAGRRSDRLPRPVARWLADLPRSNAYVCVISLLEIEVGIRRLERSDPVQGERLRRWKIQSVNEAFRDRILPVDEAVAEVCAALHVPDPKPHLDALIAATAIVHEMTLVTRNVVDFRSMPVAIFNPWSLSAE